MCAPCQSRRSWANIETIANHAGIAIDDDPVSFPERASEPSYFQRPAIVAADPVDAEILWFNASKGFGFVKLSDGTEAYLHIRVLEDAGSRAVSEGTRLKVAVEESPRGHQVVHVLEISDQIAKTPADTSRAGESIADMGAQLKSQGTVKRYNPKKGCWWKDRRCLSNAGRARKGWKSGAFAWPRRQYIGQGPNCSYKEKAHCREEVAVGSI